jgi:hypothetical protein
MSRFRSIAFAALIAAVAFPARPETPSPAALQVLGSVTNAARPVANALIIALNLADFDATETYSALDGSFTLAALPHGIYKIIAVKQGFLPAVAMVLPSKANQRLKLSLRTEKPNPNKSASQEIWEIRGSLPPDVLREIDLVLSPQPVQMTSSSQAGPASLELPRFRAEMVSMTGVSNQAATAGFAQTSLGVESRVGGTWQLGVKGAVHRIEDPTDDTRFGQAAAQASTMSMELRSSPTDAYRIASTSTWWRYRDGEPVPDHQADLRSHNFEWEHGAARVGVRYLGQQNLFPSTPFGSDTLEITGGATLMQTRHTDLGVSLRVTQESLRSTGAETLRTADVTANGSLALVPSFNIHYGLSSRIGIDGTEWAPRTGMEWKLGKDTALVGSAMFKVNQASRTIPLPSIVVWSDEGRGLPRYSYSFGIVSGEENASRLSAIMTVTSVDSPLRVIFTDNYEQFWDGLMIDSGDVRRDLRVSYRKDFAGKIAIDISGTAGTATQTSTTLNAGTKAYVTGDVQTIFFPTGTSLLVSYRGIHQPREDARDYHSERVNLRMAQSLHLPLDLKLLLGLELARAENSPFLLDTLEASGATKRYVGGLAMNF